MREIPMEPGRPLLSGKIYPPARNNRGLPAFGGREALPEFQQLLPHHPLRIHTRRLSQHLSVWAEWSGCRLVNSMRRWLSITKTVSGAVHSATRFFDALYADYEQSGPGDAFCERHKNRVINKSISGVRSIVQPNLRTDAKN